MKSSYVIQDVFHCSLERAFKAPMLGDATRFMKGYLFQPPVSGFDEDDTWGNEHDVRYPLSNGNLFVPKGRMFRDVILVKAEQKYWKWKLHAFKLKAMFFVDHAIGEWTVALRSENIVSVEYRYTYSAKHWLYAPVLWLFVQIQIRGIMLRAIKGIKEQAESANPFIYEQRK